MVWYARSAEFMQRPIIQLRVWMRVPGDTIFSVSALALSWFVLRLWSVPRRETTPIGEAETGIGPGNVRARPGGQAQDPANPGMAGGLSLCEPDLDQCRRRIPA